MFNQSTLRLYDISSRYAPSFTLSFCRSLPFFAPPVQPMDGGPTFQNLPNISKVTTPQCLTFDRRWLKCVCSTPSRSTHGDKDVYIVHIGRRIRSLHRMEIVGRYKEECKEKLNVLCVKGNDIRTRVANAKKTKIVRIAQSKHFHLIVIS